MTIADRLRAVEVQAGDLQQALSEAHEWQALTHLQNAMSELHQAQKCTTAYQVDLAKALIAGVQESGS